MDDLNKLQTLWQSASPVALPDAMEIKKNIKEFRSTKLRNKILSVIVAITTILLSLFVLMTVKNFWFSTQLAIILNVISCLILATTNLRSMKRFAQLKDLSNLEFLQFLQQTRQNQIYYHKRTQVAGLILATASTLLLPYQLVVHSLTLAIITYSLIFTWIAVLWCYIRPKTFNKHSKKLSTEVLRFENIIKQTL